MNLVNELTSHMGQEIKIGFTNGSSFIYCDTCDENTLNTLGHIEEILIRQTKDNLEGSKDRKKSLEKMGKAGWISYEKDRLYNIALRNGKKEREIKLPSNEELEKRYKQMIEALKRLIAKYTECLSHEHPVLGAELVEAYPSIVNDNECCLIFEGIFTGAFWTREEYLDGKERLYGLS